jgi:hypothetical protein
VEECLVHEKAVEEHIDSSHSALAPCSSIGVSVV